jgi:PAS domain-containing protein
MSIDASSPQTSQGLISRQPLIAALAPLQKLTSRARASQAPLAALLLLRATEEVVIAQFEALAARADRGYAAFDDVFDLAARVGVAAYATDADGFLQQFNEQACQLWGWSPPMGVQRWGGAWRLRHRDGRPRPMDDSPMAIALRERRQVREDAVHGWRPDKRSLAMRPLALPIRSHLYGMLGGVNLLLDVRERVRLEKANIARPARSGG